MIGIRVESAERGDYIQPSPDESRCETFYKPSDPEAHVVLRPLGVGFIALLSGRCGPSHFPVTRLQSFEDNPKAEAEFFQHHVEKASVCKEVIGVVVPPQRGRGPFRSS